MILNDTNRLIRQKYGDTFNSLTIEDLIFGLRLTAVRLSDGSAGLASTLSQPAIPCSKHNRDFGEFTPGNFKGQSVKSLFETAKQSELIDTLRIAVLNAISSNLISKGKYRIVENADPIDLIDLSGEKSIVMVGAFNSYIEKIAATRNHLSVLELDETAVLSEHARFFVAAAKYSEIIPQADILLITGLTLVNGTLDPLIAAVSPGTQVVVTGPSGSVLPDVLFANKVNLVGATRVTDAEKLFEIASQAGAGYHLFRYCAQKICILND